MMKKTKLTIVSDKRIVLVCPCCKDKFHLELESIFP